MRHFVKRLLNQRWQTIRGQNEYTLNPVKFSLNCFLATLFMKIPGPVYVCGLGKKIICVGKNVVGVGGIELGVIF